MATAAAAETVEYVYDGIYAPREVAGYLLAGMPKEYQQRNPPTPHRVHRWIRVGLVAPEERGTPGRERVMDFEDLVTCQAITVLRERTRLTLRQILDAERTVARIFGMDRPFARKRFWFSTRELVAALDDETVVSAVRGGQIGWRKVIMPALEELGQFIEFEPRTGAAVEWEPPRWRGIALAPDVLFGAPCLKGTRIPTDALANYAEAGEDPALIASSYGIEVADIERAADWEREVRRALDAVARPAAARVSHRP